MRFVFLEEFQKYTGVFNDSPIQESFIGAAQGIVENYLGYELKLQKYETYIDGNGNSEVSLKARPIKRLIKVVINDENIDLKNFRLINEFIIYYNRFPTGTKNVYVEYEAGYDYLNKDTFNNLLDCGDSESEIDEPIIDGGNSNSEYENIIDCGNSLFKSNINYIPEIIKSTILRIAAILQSESDSNIGVTSKSFGDSGNRTFINYTNFDKYLQPISSYRILRI